MRQAQPILTIVGLVATLACLATLLSGCGIPLEKSLNESLIAFRRDNKIWTAQGDGAGQKQLTNGFAASPAISPDGRTIVYEHSEGDPKAIRREDRLLDPGPAIGLYSIPSSGGIPKLLTPEPWLTGSGWIPLMNIDKQVPMEKWWVKRECMQPSFSPDGKTICFIINDVFNYKVRFPHSGELGYDEIGSVGIATMNADGTGEPHVVIELDRNGGMEINLQNPQFSPDGKEIFVSYCSWKTGVSFVRVPVTGGKISHSEAMSGSAPRCNAFGISNVLEEIAASDTNNTITLMGMDEEVDHVINVSPQRVPTEASESPCFTADGNVIAFVSEINEHDAAKRDIYIIPTSGGTPKILITNADQPCFGKKVSD